ncbi:MAG: hypothetical protein ACR2RE_02705 [Geminicoccaceae bacterium]
MRTDLMAAMGRGGDRMMGHLTPGETVIPSGAMTPKLWAAFQEALDRQGMMPEQYVVGSGQNSINPMTGQPEFLAQASGPGRSVRDYQERSRSSNPTGRDAREGGANERAPVVAPAPVIFPTSPEMGGSIPRRQQQAMIETVPMGDPFSDPTGGDINWGVTSGGEFGEVKSTDFGPLVDIIVPGPIGPLLDLADLDMTVDYVDPMNVPGMASTHEFNVGPEGGSSERQRPMQGTAAQRRAVAEAYTRPATIPTPQFLGLSSSMSPLQQRSAIASRAVAGQAGEYFSPEAQAFYDNLLQRALIDDTGGLMGLDTLLPIDLQYLAQIRGIENPADTQSLLSALAQ